MVAVRRTGSSADLEDSAPRWRSWRQRQAGGRGQGRGGWWRGGTVGPVTSRAAPDARALRRATRGVYLVFIGSGLSFASWAARIPQVREELNLTPAALGLVLLAVAAGSLIALPLAGLIVHRIGAAKTIVVMSLILATGIATAGVGVLVGVAPLVIGLVLLGFGNGGWDVAMNVEAAAVEQQLGRSVMSRFHAGFPGYPRRRTPAHIRGPVWPWAIVPASRCAAAPNASVASAKSFRSSGPTLRRDNRRWPSCRPRIVRR